jgi:hypothetical protein
LKLLTPIRFESETRIEADALNPDAQHSDFIITQKFMNTMNRRVVTLDRNNIPLCHREHYGGIGNGKSGFEIRTSVTFYNAMYEPSRQIKVFGQMVANLKSLSNSSELLEEMKASFNRAVDQRLKFLSFTVVQFIPEERFLLSEAVFDVKSGVLAVINDCHSNYVHPDSEVARRQQSFMPVTQKSPRGYLIEIVDNNSEKNTRFMYTGNGVMAIPSCRDLDRPDGVYYYEYIGDDLVENSQHAQVCSIEEAETKFGLYKTREEAMTAGNPKIMAEKALAVQMQELADKKASLEEMMLQHKEHEAKLKARELERKDYYDERSSSRKDSSEWLKMGAALLTGFGTAALILVGRK